MKVKFSGIFFIILTLLGVVFLMAQGEGQEVKMEDGKVKGNQVLESKVPVTNVDGLTAQVFASDGKAVAATITKSAEGSETRLKVTPPVSFKPGKYTLRARSSDGKTFVQDFMWGVLAVNPSKSVYAPGETARLSFGVLDEEGFMDCHAQITLKITHTEQGKKIEDILSTESKQIVVNPECYVKNYTERPDFEAEYQVGGPGEYLMEMSAITKNGNYTISDVFGVDAHAPFDVERVTNTRIFPVKPVPVRMHITARVDFTGQIIETTPATYKIMPLEDVGKYATTEKKDLLQDVIWNVQMKKGQQITIGYRYDAPDESPEFHLLGPLKFKAKNGELVFQEYRQWQIAVDAEVTIDATVGVTANQAGRHNGAGATSVFTTDQIGYVFYSDEDNICAYIKTTDGGASWSTTADISTINSCSRISVWYDQWTPRDVSGTLIRIVMQMGSTDDYYYNELNTSNDTLAVSSALNITSTTYLNSINASGNTGIIHLVKGVDGVTYAGAQDGGTAGDQSYVLKCSASCTASASNWTDTGRTTLDLNDSTDAGADEDEIFMVPLFNNDILLIRYTDGASAGNDFIDSKIYTATSGRWDSSWTSVATGLTHTGTKHGTASAVVSRETGDVYMVFTNNSGNATSDLRFTNYRNKAWATPTDIITNYAETATSSLANPSLSIDENIGTLYVVYGRRRSAPTPGTADDEYFVNWRSSTDNGTSWSSQSSDLNSAAYQDIFGVRVNPYTTERVFATWTSCNVDDCFVNSGFQQIYYGSTIVDLIPGGTKFEGVRMEGVRVN